MKILVFGAGVIGSIYAARLREAGYDVTLLARGKRHEDLKENGVILRDALTGRSKQPLKLPLTQKLGADEFYDLIIVTVRLDQIEPVIPILKENSVCPLIMFMLNNPEDIAHLRDALAPKQIILGFPGAGGAYRDKVLEYIRIKQQKTTIGEINGKLPACIYEIKRVLENAKFEVAVSTDMQAWLKIHAVFIACIAAAIVKENGDSVQLSKKRSGVEMMVRSVSEGFSACKALGISIAPTNLKIIFMIMPRWFTILYWQYALKGKLGTLAAAPHANAAKKEIQLLAKKVMTMVHSSGRPTPTLDKLLLSTLYRPARILSISASRS